MDFAFGTLSTDELKRYHHQLMRQGVRHGHKIAPRVPRANEPISLFVTTGVDVTADFVACYFTTDGTEPTGSRGIATNGTAAMLTVLESEWDSIIWGYTTSWTIVLPGFPTGTRLRYRIGAWSNSGEEIFADYPDTKMSTENAAHRHFNQQLPPDPTVYWGDTSPGTIFTLKIGQAMAPTWAREAIIYHLMVDRFNPGTGRTWLQTGDVRTFMGGTLHGVYEKLDYLVDLGINTLWMSPIWTTPSWHGYDTSDFREVEPRLGDKAILRRLIDMAHDKGLRVLFDMACNHISNHHPIFHTALTDSTSPYRDWFHFDDSALGYRGFFGVESMPEINLDRPDARDWMIEHALYWLREFDIDGYRLDYANGARPDFWSYFVDACKSEKADTFYFGEIIEPPNMLQPYIGRLDGALDFQINFALRQTYGWKTWSTCDFQRFLQRHQQYMPADFIMPAFIDNHDMDRFMYITNDDKQAQLAALEILMGLPNPPVILYGTEVGLSQRVGARDFGLDAIREAMPWGNEQDSVTLGKTRALIANRKSGTNGNA